MALQQAVDLLEKMLAQEEERRLTEINLGDPLFEPVGGDETIKTLEEIIQEGDDVVGAHQLVGKYVVCVLCLYLSCTTFTPHILITILFFNSETD
ncbi:hypothetical protein [Cynomolgus macaque cytomegalovirus strain Mauritius]|uniref:Uncharacterized protein n=1 Tax=Cynomolgus macaque cytomegalovirus strain Mauritius TaxID=1690255 RepID=A0A0K1H077_9BETA|nr:hypothetical protein [Cynomolgus macaque cytomegalovirus strain Mauritius]AXG21868.1 hypothetical protein [synthetic construct]AXG22136.1 hypothetical protein [synthetic construct]